MINIPQSFVGVGVVCVEEEEGENFPFHPPGVQICVYTPFMQTLPTFVCWAVLQMRNAAAGKGQWHGADAPAALPHLMSAAAGNGVCCPLASPRGSASESSSN